MEVGVGMGAELGHNRQFLNIVSTLILRPEEDFVLPLNFTVKKRFP